jgi:hypothetical protein
MGTLCEEDIDDQRGEVGDHTGVVRDRDSEPLDRDLDHRLCAAERSCSAIERNLGLCLTATAQARAERLLELEHRSRLEAFVSEQSARIAELQIEGEECARHLEGEIDRLLERVQAATPLKRNKSEASPSAVQRDEGAPSEGEGESGDEQVGRGKRALEASLSRAKQERDAALERERVALRQSDDACKALKDLHAAYLVNLKRKARSLPSDPCQAGKQTLT